MPAPPPDPALRRALEQVDVLRHELRAERIKSGHLQGKLVRAGLAGDAAPKPPPKPAPQRR